MKNEADHMIKSEEEASALTLEAAFEQIEEVLGKLEAEDTTLEESFQVYQEGMRLLKICNDKIDHVEKQVMVMSEKGELNEF